MSDTWNPNLYKSHHSFVYNYGKILIDLLDPKEDEEILDIGCGTGELTNEIFQKTHLVTGIDSSKKMIIEAKNTYPHINFLNIDSLTMDYKNKFDKVFSNAVFHWIFDQNILLANIYKSLKSNGKLIVEMGGKGNAGTILDSLKETLFEHGYVENSKKDFTFFPSVGEYTNLLEKAGFTIRYLSYFDRPTELNGDDGLKNFITMFYSTYFKDLDENTINKILDEVEKKCKPLLFKDNKWYADYKRLRFVAEKI